MTSQIALVQSQGYLESEAASLLVFSVAGRIGSGATIVANKLRDELYAYKYDIVMIDVSMLIRLSTLGKIEDHDKPPDQLVTEIDSRFESQFSTAKDRTNALQNAGNVLRDQYGLDVLARTVVSEVIKPHLENQLGVRKRQAFIIDSLKRPEEVAYLRKVFGNAYFAVGVVSTDAKRRERLRERKGYTTEIFESLSERDRNEKGPKCGQRAVDTVLKSDYFFANNYSTKNELKPEISRFVGLVFNSSMITPRGDEFAMNIAFKSAARSACLSRQVGASIVDASGGLLATGCNDVPKFGGGLYSSEDQHDRRCWTRGAKCYNDEEKGLIEKELIDSIVEDNTVKELVEERKASLQGFSIEDLRKVLAEVVGKSRIRQLIEFSRAVHAEMDAIMSIARAGRSGLVSATLYCTTYPCHNCAKHIIDAGITRLVYLEPYEKSLARKLHEDAINDISEDGQDRFVLFELYNGVSPRRYAEFFDMTTARKTNGSFVDRSEGLATLVPSHSEDADELWRRIEKQASPSKSNGGNCDTNE